MLQNILRTLPSALEGSLQDQGQRALRRPAIHLGMVSTNLLNLPAVLVSPQVTELRILSEDIVEWRHGLLLQSR